MHQLPRLEMSGGSRFLLAIDFQRKAGMNLSHFNFNERLLNCVSEALPIRKVIAEKYAF